MHSTDQETCDFSLPRSSVLTISETEAHERIEEYEYDLPAQPPGLVLTLFLAPFRLVIGIVSALWDVWMLIPAFFHEFGRQAYDLWKAVGFYWDQFTGLMWRCLLDPVLFLIHDPVGFVCFQADRLRYALLVIGWRVRSLWLELLSQLEDVGRLLDLSWMNPTPVPVTAHSVPPRSSRRSRRQLLQLQLDLCTVDPNEPLEPAPKSEQHPAAKRRGRTRFEIRPASDSALPEHPVFVESARTRLASDEPGPESDQHQHAARQDSGDREYGWYGRFCTTCPSCLSEEVYAVRSNGIFADSPRQRAWLVQNLFCERCITPFRRPGVLLLAPRPLLRPKDTEMYDK